MENHRDMGSYAAGEGLTVLEAYDSILCRAQAARAALLYNALHNCAHQLRERVCAGAEKLRINFCPLCCD